MKQAGSDSQKPSIEKNLGISFIEFMWSKGNIEKSIIQHFTNWKALMCLFLIISILPAQTFISCQESMPKTHWVGITSPKTRARKDVSE